MTQVTLNGWLLWLVAWLALIGAFAMIQIFFGLLSERFDFLALLTRLPWFNDKETFNDKN